MVGQGFNECVNYTLRAGQELSTWVSQTAAAELALANPFAEDQSHLRPTLVIGLLDTLKTNQARGVEAAQLFETGRVFIEQNGQNFEWVAAAFIVAETTARSWLKREPVDFYQAKALTGILAGAAGVNLGQADLKQIDDPFYGWQAGHCAVAGGSANGWTARFGLLDLAMVRAHGIEGKVYAGIFAILPDKLAEVVGATRRRYQPFSLFPAALRDLALVVDESVPSETVRRELLKAARKATQGTFAVENVEIFDVYRGAGLPEGKKSLAFSLSFRAPDRTLTDTEVNAVFEKTQTALIAATPYQIRK
jgi:phenylalanyl-tRNA synthetase beta chain